MSMTDAQTSAFQNASGFSPQSSSTLWLSLVLVLALLWFGAFGGSAVRVLLALLVLMFFTLS
jgi:hypothetical protein